MDFSCHNSVAVLALPPEVGYPRITMAVIRELDNLLDEVRLSGLFRGVVIAANSDSFATGASVDEVASIEGATAFHFAGAGQILFNHIAGFQLPVVAAIRGYCLGGGLDLALACHARVATYDASFAYPGVADEDLSRSTPFTRWGSHF